MGQKEAQLRALREQRERERRGEITAATQTVAPEPATSEDRLTPDGVPDSPPSPVLSPVKGRTGMQFGGENRPREKRARGRPSLGRPWESEGTSRATWFRRKKECSAITPLPMSS
jgi:hypothetical protein